MPIKFLPKKRQVSIFGIRAVGKTTYLVMLINRLSKMLNVSNMHILSGLDYYMRMMNWILRGEGAPPTKTEERLLIHVRMKVDGQKVEVRTYDLAGAEIERMGDTFRALIDVGDGYIFLVEPSPDPDKKVIQVWLIYRFIEYLSDNFRKMIKKPIAFVFTKNDLYGIKDPEKFFWNYTAPVYNLAQIFRQIKKYNFFAVSAFGGDLETLRAQGRDPEPVNIEKPFFWVVETS